MKINSSAIVAFVVVLVALGTGYALLSNQPERERQVTKNSLTKTMEEIVMAEDGVIGILLSDEGTKEVFLPDNGNVESVGSAYMLRKNGKLYHGVIVNLPEPEEGSFYQGWLVNNGPRDKYLSTGKMYKDRTGMYLISYTSNNQYEGYDQVLVTLETSEDNLPEKLVLEGSF